jgi:hypothetical protein
LQTAIREGTGCVDIVAELDKLTGVPSAPLPVDR